MSQTQSVTGAPAGSTTATTTQPNTVADKVAKLTLKGGYQPLVPTGVLDKNDWVDLTPVIGREFRNVNLGELIDAPNSDELIRELAIIVSRRNVVFFRNQKERLTDDQLKKLARKMGEQSNGPSESGLHIHPTEHIPDLELSPINASFIRRKPPFMTQLASAAWHSDVTFEPVPSSYAILNMYSLPDSPGGDTVWASAYEAYDRLTPQFAKFLEGLTATHDGNHFHGRAKQLGIDVHEGPRGHPDNIGANLVAVHPVIRTNPVTGWKGLFVNKTFTKRINELNFDESEFVLNYLFSVITHNHDLQVRYKWELNDVAIWSNSSSFHNVTVDYTHGTRAGNRVVTVGEKPFFDPNSVSRRAALGLPAW